jgi:hypothetical protein
MAAIKRNRNINFIVDPPLIAAAVPSACARRQQTLELLRLNDLKTGTLPD